VNALAVRSLTEDQVALIKRTICRDGTDDDLKLFIGVCQATGLNPFMKQIYAVFRREKGRDGKTMTIQTGIDGLRLTADRSGKYAGQLSPQWCGADGKWLDVWLDAQNPPAAARVGVLRSDFSQPCYGVATWASYAVWEPVYVDGRPSGEMKLGRFWAKLGPEQLAKCAEALALRKAFPAETAGLRSDDEMAQADNDVWIKASVDAPASHAAPASPEPVKSLPPSAPPQDLKSDLAAKRAKAKAEKVAAKAAQNPQAGSTPHGPATPPASESNKAPAGGDSSTQARLTDLVARLGGDSFEDLAIVLLEGNPEDKDRHVAESTRKAVIGRGISAEALAAEAKRIGVTDGEPTIAQCLQLALALPLPEKVGAK
jgi:phage recombination protein Bet